MSAIMKVPLLFPLQRRTGMPQTGKNIEQRHQMPRGEFRLRRCAKDLAKKSILLIDDVITTGTTIKRCAEALQPVFPSVIHGLSFCIV
jgi:predicted amidophosphoribosyltransferase